jgi:hypothetical protein
MMCQLRNCGTSWDNQTYIKEAASASYEAQSAAKYEYIQDKLNIYSRIDTTKHCCDIRTNWKTTDMYIRKLI